MIKSKKNNKNKLTTTFLLRIQLQMICNLLLLPARRMLWSCSQGTWKCWGPRAPSCDSPCQSVHGKTPYRFGRRSAWSWPAAEVSRPGRGSQGLQCSAGDGQSQQRERRKPAKCYQADSFIQRLTTLSKHAGALFLEVKLRYELDSS